MIMRLSDQLIRAEGVRAVRRLDENLVLYIQPRPGDPVIRKVAVCPDRRVSAMWFRRLRRHMGKSILIGQDLLVLTETLVSIQCHEGDLASVVTTFKNFRASVHDQDLDGLEQQLFGQEAEDQDPAERLAMNVLNRLKALVGSDDLLIRTDLYSEGIREGLRMALVTISEELE